MSRCTQRSCLLLVAICLRTTSFAQHTIEHVGNSDRLYIVHCTGDLPEDLAALRFGYPGNVLRLKGVDDRKGRRKYRVLQVEREEFIKVHYIFLNGRELSMPSIDSLRVLIMEQLKEGRPFEEISARYGMDGNASGDLKWSAASNLVAEFSTAVIAHRKGDIFTVDVPDNSWYYVVRKDEEERTEATYTLERVSR